MNLTTQYIDSGIQYSGALEFIKVHPLISVLAVVGTEFLILWIIDKFIWTDISHGDDCC